ncbi:MAG TPA: histidine--tRNA ligase, partial [Myxococcaceae bacterium]|nr:histidine--tRNA ligase [Myxococcaceae bacterium]
MSQRITGVKGMNDLLPGRIEIWQHLEQVARRTFRAFGYQEIRTPIVEDTALFVRSVGEA